MELIIQKESVAEDVKNFFTEHYPFLKIELYKMHVPGKQPTKREMLPSGFPLGSFINASNNKIVDISGHVTVAELEKEFTSLGLMAEVFRKSGNVWIVTILTNDWTLHQQNAEGEEISRHFNQKRISSS